jgi:hypothetical protein
MKRRLPTAFKTSSRAILLGTGVRAAARRCSALILSIALALPGATALRAQTIAPNNTQGMNTGLAAGSGGAMSDTTTTATTGPNGGTTSTSMDVRVPTAGAGTAATGFPAGESATSGSTNSMASGSSLGTAALSNSSTSINARSSTNPDTALQLPGEAPNSSSNVAKTTASTAGAASPGAICGPAVPSTDGGSVNLTEVVPGASLNGC